MWPNPQEICGHVDDLNRGLIVLFDLLGEVYKKRVLQVEKYFFWKKMCLKWKLNICPDGLVIRNNHQRWSAGL